MINHMNQQCKQEAMEKSLILPICCADERTANYCKVSVAAMKQIRRESRERNYALLKPFILTRSVCFHRNIHLHCQGQSFSPE
jgi:hypothetical protein